MLINHFFFRRLNSYYYYYYFLYSTEERERSKNKNKSYLSFSDRKDVVERGSSFFLDVHVYNLYTMTLPNRKYAHSCRFRFLPTKNNHKKFIKIDHRKSILESKYLFSSGNTTIFHHQTPVFHHPCFVVKLLANIAFSETLKYPSAK